jgi:hypothetical protein
MSRHMLRPATKHWLHKALADLAAIAYFDFASASTTFTAGMAKRTAPGPFAAAPIVQGDGNNLSSLTDDVLSLARGTQVSGSFYPAFDGNQGSVVLWWTPEFDYDTYSGAGDGYIWYASSAYNLAYEYDNDRYALTIGGQSLTVSSNIAAGTKYLLTARWDCDVTLDGTNYLCLSINDTHSFGATTGPTAAAPAATIYVGTNGTTGAASGIIEGMTVYRRVLYDGTYGVNAGNGDEINLTYAAGAGKDPTEITGSWDVVFCLPTNASKGALATGTGEAWTHPHASNVLTDWHCATTYGSSAWDTVGTPSTAPDDLAAADKIFAWGYDWTCDADAEGIEQSLTSLDAGQSYVLRCLAHVSDANDLRIRIYDDTNSADIVTYEFGASSDRDTPGVAIITFELPTTARNGSAADCTAITVSVEGTAASQQVYLHQIELLENLVDNPSLETGSGDPWIPDGWTNHSGQLTAGESVSSADVHSGSSSFKLDAANAGDSNIRQTLGPFTLGDFVAYGFAAKISVGTASFGVWYLQRQRSLFALYTYNQLVTTADWAQYHWIGRMHEKSGNSFAYFPSVGTETTAYLDDVYVYAITPVSLTVTPASEANSTESSGIRVDGLDTLTQSISNLTATDGHVRFAYTPRHDAADAVKFGTASTQAMIAELYGAADNYIRLYWSAANTITMAFNDGGGEHTTTYDATGAIAAGTTYQMALNYSAEAMTLDIAGSTVATITTAISFATVPTTAYWGQAQAGTKQADATYAAPTV